MWMQKATPTAVTLFSELFLNIQTILISFEIQMIQGKKTILYLIFWEVSVLVLVSSLIFSCKVESMNKGIL